MNSSPSSSPRLTKKPAATGHTGPLESSVDSTLSDEEEVKRKPSSVLEENSLTNSGERKIKCLLDTVDVQLKKSRDFAEKLAQKK